MNIQIECYTIVLECLLTVYFFHKMLQPHYSCWMKILGIYMVYLGILLATTIYLPISVRLGSICLYLFLVYYFYLKQSPIQISYTIVLFFVTAMFADLISGFILSQMGIPISEIMGISAGRLIYNSTAKLMHLLLLVLLSSAIQHYYDSHALFHAIPLILCNAVSIFILSVQFDNFISSHEYAPFVASTVGMLLINIIICYYTESVKYSYEIRKQKFQMEEQMKQQEKYYKDIIANQEEFRALWHDINKYMLAMETLVAKHRNFEANAQLLFLQRNCENLNYIVNTGNPMVDGILNYGMKKSQNAHIPMKLDLWIDPTLEFSPVDFDIILGNTIDNAVEACCMIPDTEFPSITCMLRQKNHVLFYEIRNPIPVSPGKKQGTIHGYGLENVKKCVRRNGGNIFISTKNHVFCVTITLNI